MFIETYGNGDVKYLRLVKSIIVTNSKGFKSSTKELVYYIGPLVKFDDGNPDYIKRLKESFRNGKPLIPELQKFCADSPLEEYNFKIIQNSPDCIGNPKLFSHVLIEKILEDLGMIRFFLQYKSLTNYDFDIVGFFRLLVYGRILNPSSKFSTLSQNDDYYNPILDNPYKYNIYDTLDFIYRFKDSIIKKLNKALKDNFNRTTNTIFYDVTNFYFEIDEADEDIEVNNEVIKGDRQFGVSKEERKQPIVQMGLFMDEQGIPISIETFPGNTLDHLTMIKSLTNTVDNLELSRFIFVGDRGMCSYKNICHLLDHNNGYIISKSIEKSSDEDQKWIMDQNDYIIESSNFKYKSRIVNRKVVKDEFNKPRTITEKVVVYWSKDFADREKAQQKSFFEFLEKLTNDPATFKITSSQYRSLKPFLKNAVQNIKTGEVIKSSDLKSLIDEDKIKSFIGHMGYYQIVSSETNKSDKEIIDIYHGLSRIEDQFKIMKGSLDARPLFVRTHEHIYSHLLICMISLIVIRIIQNKIVDYHNNINQDKKSSKQTCWKMGLNSDRLINALNKWTVDTLPNEYYRFNNINNEDLELILNAFNITIPVKLFRKAELKHIKQTIDSSK